MPDIGDTLRDRFTVPVASFAFGCLRFTVSLPCSNDPHHRRAGARNPLTARHGFPTDVVFLSHGRNKTMYTLVFIKRLPRVPEKYSLPTDSQVSHLPIF